MRNPDNVFHLAIPSGDLDATARFYEALGCRVARRYDDRVTLDFFGDQVVCHLSPEDIVAEPKLYPRHFGVTFKNGEEYERILGAVQAKGLPFFKPPFVRFEGKREEHRTFFLIDPSNNLLEFKYYVDSSMMY